MRVLRDPLAAVVDFGASGVAVANAANVGDTGGATELIAGDRLDLAPTTR